MNDIEWDATSNPYLDYYQEFCRKNTKSIDSIFNPDIDEEKRIALYNSIDIKVAMVRRQMVLITCY